MCIIVDANAVHHLALKSEAGKPVLKWLLKGAKAGLVVGGKNLEEIDKPSLRGMFTELKRAGRYHRVDEIKLKTKVDELGAAGTCVSNDAHVVALALVSRCRLVFSHDDALHTDLRTHSPTGGRIAIYQDSSHGHLLEPCKCFMTA